MRKRGIFFDLYGTLLVYGNMKQAWSDWLAAFYGSLKKRGLNIAQEIFAQKCDGFFSSAEPVAAGNKLTALERLKAMEDRRIPLGKPYFPCL